MYHNEDEMISIPKSEYFRLLEIEKDTYAKALELADKRMKLHEEWESIYKENERFYKVKISSMQKELSSMINNNRERRRYR